MTVFRVWAPRARTVDVDVAGSRQPMAADRSGWWSAEVEGAEAGVDYAFVLDGGDPLPDPRSPWQPEGVCGLSPRAIW